MNKITAPPVQDEGRLVVPPAFTPGFSGSLGLRCNGRTQPSYDTVHLYPCEVNAPQGEAGVDFAAPSVAFHQPAALCKRIQSVVSGRVL
jgi:hypothetical protein